MEHRAGCVGRHVPSRRPRLRFRGGHVWSRTLRLGQHRRLPALAGMGTRVWGGRAPRSLPCRGRRAVLDSPRPPASLPWGPGQRGEGSVLEGTASLSLPHIPLPHRLYLKGGKSQLGARHRRERGAGQGSSVGSASRYAGWEGHCTWQRGQEDVYHPGQARLLPCASSLSQAPARHSPHQRWEYGTRGDSHQCLPAVPVPGSASPRGRDPPCPRSPQHPSVSTHVPTPICEHPLLSPMGSKGLGSPWQQVTAPPGRGPPEGRDSLPVSSLLQMNPR